MSVNSVNNIINEVCQLSFVQIIMDLCKSPSKTTPVMERDILISMRACVHVNCSKTILLVTQLVDDLKHDVFAIMVIREIILWVGFHVIKRDRPNK